MIRIHKRLLAAIFLVELSFLSSVMAAPAVGVETPWIREAPPTSTVLAAYMVLRNNGDTQYTISRIESPDFRDARIHRTLVEDGVAKMVPVEQLPLPVHGNVTLEPGGLHLMLFDPLRSLREGDNVKLVIHMSNGDSVTVQVPVVRNSGDIDHAHHHH